MASVSVERRALYGGWGFTNHKRNSFPVQKRISFALVVSTVMAGVLYRTGVPRSLSTRDCLSRQLPLMAAEQERHQAGDPCTV